MSVYNQAFYRAQRDGALRSAQAIVPLVLDIVAARSAVDVGCGIGAFVKTFQDRGIVDVLGIDGGYVPRDMLMIEPERFRAHDLAAPLTLERRFDVALSLEVAEHLPAPAAEGFVDSLCRLSDVVVFSAAVPGSAGTPSLWPQVHVNEQWQSWWVERFAARGYVLHDVLRPLLWDRSEVEWWYRQDILLFARPEAPIRVDGLAAMPVLDVVHPELFAQRARDHLGLRDLIESYIASGGAYRFRRGERGGIVITRVDTPPS